MENAKEREFRITITSGTIIKVAVVLLLSWFLYFFRDLLIVMLTALVFASAIEPIIVWLGKYKIWRTFAVICIYLFLALVIVGIFYFFVPSLLADLSDFFDNLPLYFENISVWNPFNSALSTAGPVVQNLGISSGFSFDKIIGQLNTFFTSTSQGLIQVVSGVFGGLLSLVLIVVFSFYFAVQEDGVAKFLKIVIPSKYEYYIIDLWHRSQTKIGRWLQGQFLLGVLIGILVYLGLMILGVRNALLLALIAAILEIIPVFGPILAAIPAVILGFVDGGLTQGLLVVGLYAIVQQFENHLIYPLVVKKIVGTPPVLVILAVIIGFKLAGVLGILLSVPIAAVFVELLDDLQKDKIARNIASTPRAA